LFFVDANVASKKADGTIETVEAKNIIIATDRSLFFAFIKIDKERIITSTEALKLKEVPNILLLLVVVLNELGQVYLRLELKVSGSGIYGPNYSRNGCLAV
jgi:dihydrolipoamide dehydrogenase